MNFKCLATASPKYGFWCRFATFVSMKVCFRVPWFLNQQPCHCSFTAPVEPPTCHPLISHSYPNCCLPSPKFRQSNQILLRPFCKGNVQRAKTLCSFRREIQKIKQKTICPCGIYFQIGLYMNLQRCATAMKIITFSKRNVQHVDQLTKLYYMFQSC